MRSVISWSIFVFLILSASLIHSQDYMAEQPVLITSAGQSSDVLMGKILAGKANLKFIFNKQAVSIIATKFGFKFCRYIFNYFFSFEMSKLNLHSEFLISRIIIRHY